MRLILFVLKYEWKIWRSLFRWITRRPVTLAPGDVPFGSSEAVIPVLWGFIVISAIEIPVFHLLIPWKSVQIIGLFLGSWGLFWMIGLLAAMKIHPHLIQRDGVRIRSGFSVDIFVPWSNIEAVRRKARNLEKSRTIQVADGVYSVVVFSQTNVDIVLREPITLPKSTEPITELRIFADDAAGFTKHALEAQPSSTH